MRLRSLSKHVREQNWFAVALDFFIVVVGILIAFQITNWNDARQSRAELALAEIDLNRDLINAYYNAAERLALSNCRVAELRQISDRLLEPGEDWEGIQVNSGTSARAIETPLRFITRDWESNLWSAGLLRGTFSQMEKGRLEQLDQLFTTAKDAEVLDDHIRTLRTRVKILSKTTKLSREARLKYFDIIAEIDEYSWGLEETSRYIINMMDDLGVVVDETIVSEWKWAVSPENHTRLTDRLGPCVKPISLPFIESELQ